MPNYRETTVSGESYQRSHRIIVENRKGDTPHITFLEEQVINLAGEEIHREAGQVTLYFDPAATIDLVNPLDDSRLDMQVSHAYLQTILYSLYRQVTLERDQA